MKKITATLLAVILVLSAVLTIPFNAAEISQEISNVSSGKISFDTYKALYVHGVLSSDDTEAWQAWQSEHDEDFNEINSNIKYFFLPTSANNKKVDIYNAFSNSVSVNGVSIAAGETATVDYSVNTEYSVQAEGKTYTLIFMKSNAEAGIYINNTDADGYGTELMTYLNADKSRSAKATGAVVDSDGNIDNTAIKKIKGRGNTSWGKAKKGYNITYNDNIKIAGMNKSKKYSILANYQDDSLSRNRFLYDLSDAVGMPYASDSRYVDFYVNGFYWGSYQICEKIEVGKNNLINDIDDTEYWNNETDSINTDFPFVCEVDASAGSDDYYVECSNGNKITIKSPELSEGDKGYNEVKKYIQEKFNAFYSAIRNKSSDLSEFADIDSITKLYLINELGKNWDSGVSSLFFVYKQDENGNYKFYGSPVWDYDNSLGNAKGIDWDLREMGVSDYEEYTGWWCKYKGKNTSSKSSSNVMNNIARHNQVLAAAPQIWFESFVPAIKDFIGETDNGIMMSYNDYYSLLKDSAEMNYKSGWLINTGSWIADHSKLSVSSYDNGIFSISGTKTYTSNFDGMFNYTVDWLKGRTNWLSSEMFADYTPSVKPINYIIGDVNNDGVLNVLDVSDLQKFLVELNTFDTIQMLSADTNKDGIINISDVSTIQKYLVEITDNNNYCGEIGEYVA